LNSFFELGDGEQVVAKHHSRYYTQDEFGSAVANWSQRLIKNPAKQFALYTQDAYPFAVMLLALIHAGKDIWIPGNNLSGTTDELTGRGCELLGDWSNSGFDYALDVQQGRMAFDVPQNLSQSQIILFTSGTTGISKPVFKCLRQLQAEIETLERCWGQLLGYSEIVSTVSHQHIYGLLFRVLWPLAAGRCFHSQTAISSELLVKQAQKACWIASPAHLKRLSEDSPWSSLTNLSAIFSSGGMLSNEAAERIDINCGKPAIEIYGSTETGGIAWRKYPQVYWMPFVGMTLMRDGESVRLYSPYLDEPNGCVLEDELTLLDEGLFVLHGRRDRIIKVEEKRLSLVKLEQFLTDGGLLDEVNALVLEHSRDTIAIAAVLSQHGLKLMQSEGRKLLIKSLKERLNGYFEPVLFPRRWLFLSEIPYNTQGKIDTVLLNQLFDQADSKLPLLHGATIKPHRVELHLKVPATLIYFSDHFPAFPLLPGIVQLAWVNHFAQLLLDFEGEFTALESLKFVKPITPNCEVMLTLEWKVTTKKLYFHFSGGNQNYSSGRLIYAEKTRESMFGDSSL
jgi:acyl-coenzyme A synthetase/AMP-(fatty) acid ligase/3-hydroxymyristoyl/3-hydroxydecanoyl-(acyl carrier protein) dehydratase